MKRWKKWISIGLVAALILMMVGCGQSKKSEPQNTAPAEKVLKIGLLRIGDSMPFYVAEQEGLFAKHGVKVKLVGFSSGKDQSVALEAGELDGVMTDMVVQGLVKKSGTDLKTVAMALGATAEEGRFLVVAAPNSGIKTPADLAGKKVAISNNTMMDFLMAQFETLNKLDGSKITKVNMPDLMLRVTTLLEGKDIQAAILPDPLAAYAVLEGATPVIDDTKLAVNLSQSVVAVTQEAIDQNHDEVAKMLAAYNEAITLMNQQPDKYRDLCLKTANVPAELAATYQTPSYTAHTVPDEASVARVVDWLLSRGLISEGYQYSDMVDKSFL